MKKDLEYYLKLPYKIEIVPIPEEEGGGYMARLSQFGTMGIVGDGETREGALADLVENQKERFSQYLEEGLAIPEPEVETEDYSGRFVLRIPKFLHRELTLVARKNGISLNQYASTRLAMNYQSECLNETLTSMIDEIKNLNKCVGDLQYRFDPSHNWSAQKNRGFWADEYPEAA